MRGQQSRTESPLYYFRLEEQILTDHLLRIIDGHVDFRRAKKRIVGTPQPRWGLLWSQFYCLAGKRSARLREKRVQIGNSGLEVLQAD
jgi:hypothetical protein